MEGQKLLNSGCELLKFMRDDPADRVVHYAIVGDGDSKTKKLVVSSLRAAGATSAKEFVELAAPKCSAPAFDLEPYRLESIIERHGGLNNDALDECTRGYTKAVEIANENLPPASFAIAVGADRAGDIFDLMICCEFEDGSSPLRQIAGTAGWFLVLAGHPEAAK